jgi:pyruvate/2-oxoacid:ferredoxin oxidoreductase beta subunit
MRNRPDLSHEHSRFWSGRSARQFLTGASLVLLLSSCSTAYYRALETVGIEKRDILVDRVEEARDAQTEAKEQFTSALDQYRSVVAVDGGDLEETYDRLNGEYERSESRAQAVTDRVDAVQQVAEDLFEEWEDELY